MKLLARLNRPWVHFIVLGSLLFYLQGVFFPEPKPVLGPLSEARLEALQKQWLASVGREPTPEQLVRMVQAELDRDMLFARALELKLHLYDTVVYQEGLAPRPVLEGVLARNFDLARRVDYRGWKIGLYVRRERSDAADAATARIMVCELEAVRRGFGRGC